jgi:uncharacterized protein YcbX
VRCWDDRLVGADLGDAAANWLNEVLGSERKVRLVTSAFRGFDRGQLDGGYVPASLRLYPCRPETAFSDGFPLLLISTASLVELNRRLKAQHGSKHKSLPLTMERFRTNLVVDGAGLEPFAEDRWKRVRIGGATFRVVKGCSRCKITTIDPGTAAEKELMGLDGATPEPLATLAQFREAGVKGNVYFGQNLVHEWTLYERLMAFLFRRRGLELRVGDAVEVLEEGEPRWDRGVTAAE